MDFEKFVEEAKNRIKEFLPEKYEDASVNIEECRKINNSYLGMVVKLEEENVQPTINLNQFYGIYQEGYELEDVLYEMGQIVQSEVPDLETEEFKIEDLRDYERVKDSLIIRVCNRETNEEMLKYVPHTIVEDMAITYHIKLGRNEEGILSTPITNDSMRMYRITKEKLHADALESSPKMNPPDIKDMNVLMKELYQKQFGGMGLSKEQIDAMVEQIPSPEFPMIVVSNTDKINGAAVLFYPNILEQIGEQLAGDYFVLPSSTHETIVIPDTGGLLYKDLIEMVTDINATQIDPREKLTDQVYHYDAEDRVFEKASRFEERKEEKSHEKKSVLKKLEQKKEKVKELGVTKSTPRKEEYSL